MNGFSHSFKSARLFAFALVGAALVSSPSLSQDLLGQSEAAISAPAAAPLSIVQRYQPAKNKTSTEPLRLLIDDAAPARSAQIAVTGVEAQSAAVQPTITVYNLSTSTR